MPINISRDFCIVWHEPSPRPGPEQLYIGTHFFTGVGGYNELAWDTNRSMSLVPIEAIKKYKVFLVNLFADQRHITQIRTYNPDAHIIALPDAYFEHALLSRYSENYLEQLKEADRLAYVSWSNRNFYENFPWASIGRSKAPFWQIPVPAGSLGYFEKIRNEYGRNLGPGETQYILSLDHGVRTQLYMGIQNLLVMAALQKKYPVRLLYINPTEETKAAAKSLQVDVEFMPYVDYTHYVKISARATLGIDLYALHGYGRNELTWCLAGLPYIGSGLTAFDGPYNKFYPYEIGGAIDFANWLLDDYHGAVEQLVRAGILLGEDLASITNCRERLNNLIKELP